MHKNKLLGEVDYQAKGKIAVEVNRKAGASIFWVELRRGCLLKGTGRVMHNVGSLLKVGDVVEFKSGNSKKRPRLVRKLKVPREVDTMKRELFSDLQSAMTFNPSIRL